MPIPTLTLKDICAICAKTPQMGMNRPHSQHTTKKVIRPNLNRWAGLSICARCRKAMSKPERVRKVNVPLEHAASPEMRVS